MSHEQHQFLIEQLEKFGKYDKNKSDQATKDDKQFRGLMLHLLGEIKTAKETKERAKSAPRATNSKPSSSSARRSQSARQPKAKTRIAEPAEEEPPGLEEEPPAVRADDEGTEKNRKQTKHEKEQSIDEEPQEPHERKVQPARSESSKERTEDEEGPTGFCQSSGGWQYDHDETWKDQQSWNDQEEYGRVDADPWHADPWHADPWQRWNPQVKRHDPWLDEATRWHNNAWYQQWQTVEARPKRPVRLDENQKGKGKGKGTGKGKECKSTNQKKKPKTDETKKKEVHFTNFTEMASHKLMGFMCELAKEHGLEDYIEVENGLPVMYTFGQQLSKACVIRCTSELRAKAVINYLRGKGDILFGPVNNQKKIRVISGFDDRSEEHKAADFQMRKLRAALYEVGVPDTVFFTEWKNWKMFYTPDGNAENRQEVARWCSTNWTYIFKGTIMATSAMWREVKQNWLELIETRREEERDFVEESEEEARRSGTDGEGTSGGDVEARAFFQRWV